MNKKLLALSLLGALVSNHVVNGDSITSALNAELQLIESEAAKIAVPVSPAVAVVKDEPAFKIKGARDVELTLDGVGRIDYTQQWNTETLNSSTGLDRASAYNGRVEIGGVVTYGKEKYGKAAIELGTRLRQQYQAGRFDKVLSTNASTVKIADAVFEVPGSSVNATVPWFKHLWSKIYINALLNREVDTDHYIKAGLFEYSLGRGISYGSSYGTSKKYLGIYSGSNNFAPFGVLLSGDMIKDRLAYEFYFARMEEKSGDFKQTTARTKAHIVGNKKSGAAGAGKANDVFAATIKGHYASDSLGDLSTSTFVMYNNAVDQRIEMANDCESKLVTVGSGFEYEKGNFEFGGEVGFNLGTEYVFNIDRNSIVLSGGFPRDEHVVARTYNNVVISGATNDTDRLNAKAPVTAAFKAVVDGYTGNDNSAILNNDSLASVSLKPAPDAGMYTLSNSAKRFRPAYKNTYAGWMGVLDAAYNWKPANMKFSVAVGHASGDANPHDKEVDKKYYGFVGVNEGYAGKRVKSVLALGARKMQSPLTADPQNKQLFDNSFTDMTFVGSGILWRLPKRDLECSTNVLGFFKDSRSLSYVYNAANDQGGWGSSYARRYMGLECNLTFDWKLLPGLSLIGEAAVFIPGSFYTDVKGLPCDGSVVTVLDEADSTGFDQLVPRLGTDPQIALNLGLQYKF